MPSLDDLKKPKAAGFKKKPYRSWNLDLLEAEEGAEAPEGAGAPPTPPEVPEAIEAIEPIGAVEGSSTSEQNLAASTSQRRTINRAQNASKQGTTTGHNRAQTPDQPGTRKNNRAQNAPKQGTTTGHNRAQTPRSSVSELTAGINEALDGPPSASCRHSVPENVDSAASTSPISEINRAQNDLVPGSSKFCAPLIDPLCPVSTPPNRAQNLSVPGSFEICAPLQPGTDRTLNRAQSSLQPGTNQTLNRAQNRAQKPLPTSPQLGAILEYMVAQQLSTGLEHTPRLKRSIVAMNLGISLSGIKNQLARLCESGFIERVSARDGRGESGTVYRVPAAVLKAVQQLSNRAQKILPTGHAESFNWAQEPSSTGHKNRAQKPGTNACSSSSFINPTTATPEPTDRTADKALYESFRDALTRFDCLDLLGPNDVMQTWRKGAFLNIEDLLESVENVVGYVRSPEGQTLKAKKGFIMTTLAKGYYGKPEGFKSLAERQLEAAQRRVVERREQKQAKFDSDFHLWLDALDKIAREELLLKILEVAPAFRTRAMCEGALRNHYARQQQQFEFVTDDEERP